ncbi:nucleotide exchange factor GrpE [Kribbia dieselivorans]|uniref:nucleotide exchange factor GrpE n=1 Tax=Kribbia dieselivorans TaxID=331526 RepID=UPI00083954A6|nr:nucleotide exchange factor GrpE [Kribbia dieselivorans]
MTDAQHEAAGAEQAAAAPAESSHDAPDVTTEPANDAPDVTTEPVNDAPATDDHPDSILAIERLADLQRLQAEYVNYKRRVDRDRDVAKDQAIHGVFEALLPVLDDLHLAREHGDLPEGGPLAAIADKLESVLGRYGLARYGAVGEAFNPEHHEALMNAPWPSDDPQVPQDATDTTVVAVLQPGYKAGERVLRAARVTVAEPE